jgi:hypothetical protein
MAKSNPINDLEKLGLIDVQKLCTLVLYEADFNHNNKFLGKSMMEHIDLTL